jgi:hypothetical protein
VDRTSVLSQTEMEKLALQIRHFLTPPAMAGENEITLGSETRVSKKTFE